jgi:hypothetical protein
MSLPDDIRRHRLFWTWHRRIGIVAALLVLVLCVTGIALNHTEGLRLDQRFVTSAWLLDWYGIDLPEDGKSFAVASDRVSLFGDRLYFNDTPVDGLVDELVGAAQARDIIVAVVGGDALLITPQGELVERLGVESGMPPGVTAVGIGAGDQIVVRSLAGIYSADEELLSWAPAGLDESGIRWSQPESLPDGLRATLSQDYRGRILPLERVLLDLHSGRLFGGWGVWLMDAAAVLLIALAVTGGWLWFGRRAK